MSKKFCARALGDLQTGLVDATRFSAQLTDSCHQPSARSRIAPGVFNLWPGLEERVGDPLPRSGLAAM